MKMLHVYRSEPNDIIKKLVEIVSEDRECTSFNLNVENPDYDKLVDMVLAADKTVCWF